MDYSNQRSLVLAHIEEHGSITSAEAVYKYGIMDLPKRISELRRLGYNINGERVRGINRFNKPCHYNVYHMGTQYHDS